jgi:transposase InsO family protein
MRAQENAALLVEIREIHEESRRTYGAPRIKGQLRRRGIRVSRHRVARLMACHGLVGVHGRRKWRRGRHPKMVPAPDLLQRNFTAARSDLLIQAAGLDDDENCQLLRGNAIECYGLERFGLTR